MIISNLETKHAGFFSSFFFMINHYIYAKINHHSFRLKTDKWLFRAEKGWEDYFLPMDFNPVQPNLRDQNDIKEIDKHAILLANYPMLLYRTIIQQIYRLNPQMEKKIEDARKTFFQSAIPSLTGLHDEEYGALFVRRGDKLIQESILIGAENYLQYLLELYPKVRNVFVQTDDYNVFLELLAFQKQNPAIQHIQLYTLCKPHLKGGMVITKETYDYCQDPNFDANVQKIPMAQNQAYLRENRENLKAFLPLEMQTPEQVREHTEDMLIGIDFLLKSKVCVTDYLSNVTRFIKFAHPNIDAVYDIIRRSNELDMRLVACPGYGMNFYLPKNGMQLNR